MKEDIKCMFGMHKFIIYKELPFIDLRGNDIGKVIINRCANCGKIKSIKIITVNQGI